MSGSGFSLRGGPKKKSKPTFVRPDGEMPIPTPPADTSATSYFRYLYQVSRGLAFIDDERCQRIRAGLIDAVKRINSAIDAFENDDSAEDKAAAIAARAVQLIEDLQPDIYEATYFLASRYLLRHRHAFPSGSDGALTDELRAAIERYAGASRAVGRVLRTDDTNAVDAAMGKLRGASKDVARALKRSPPAELDPA
ncbi:MAG: hypothetical protein AAF658_05155 [Myxococcota bacterium]